MNIIFDLGGVILDWQPKLLIGRLFHEDVDRAKVWSDVLRHSDWLDLDRGTLDWETAATRAARRTGIAKASIRELFEQIPKSLTPITDTLNLIKEIKEMGHRLFILSNMHEEAATQIERELDVWSLFEPPMFSCRVNMVKPEISIYQHLLDCHQLEASNTVFIDDTQVNVDSAANLGIHTIKFESAQQCRQQLKELGCV